MTYYLTNYFVYADGSNPTSTFQNRYRVTFWQLAFLNLLLSSYANSMSSERFVVCLFILSTCVNTHLSTDGTRAPGSYKMLKPGLGAYNKHTDLLLTKFESREKKKFLIQSRLPEKLTRYNVGFWVTKLTHHFTGYKSTFYFSANLVTKNYTQLINKLTVLCKIYWLFTFIEINGSK